MSFDLDEDILQDFLVEAAEILEQLSEQLVDLENNPEDKDLLNAIFRGFHTVKGGAGFLSLTPLVDACHGAENVFDVLRNGGRSITPELMDVILAALDSVNDMFTQVQAREELTPAPADIIEKLHFYCTPESEQAVDEAPAPAAPETTTVETTTQSAGGVDDITDDEFEKLLDELHSGSTAKPAAAATPSPAATPAASVASSSEMTDDEFEKLLDDLHGAGSATPVAAPAAPTPAPAAPGADGIGDDEFEKLLDELHGNGKSPVAPSPAAKPAAATPKPVAKPAAAPKAPAESKKAETKAPVKAPPQGETTVRVDTRTLDEIMNMVGELVLVRNRLVSLGLTSNDEEMSKATANLDVVTADLQGAVMKTRMQPIKKVFGRFPRVVRDLARTLKKDINLELVGEDTDLDKNLVEALADPLVHLVRNSVDHGIEMPAERESAGKKRTGTIRLSASQEGDHILLTIEDDGAGMDADKLKNIAISRGVLDNDAAERMSNKEAYALIFAPGFSTKTEISDISGRGVGMDVVKTSITQLNGTVDIDSAMGEGTTLQIKVPLTLAILQTLMVDIGNQTFAFPLTSVNEIFHLDLSKTNVVDGQETVIVRSKAIPLFYLQDWLNRNGQMGERKKEGHVVIVQIGPKQVGFVVNNLIGQEEVVIKALDELLTGTPGMAGATITSDGRIALILDIPNLLNHYARRV